MKSTEQKDFKNKNHHCGEKTKEPKPLTIIQQHIQQYPYNTPPDWKNKNESIAIFPFQTKRQSIPATGPVLAAFACFGAVFRLRRFRLASTAFGIARPDEKVKHNVAVTGGALMFHV